MINNVGKNEDKDREELEWDHERVQKIFPVVIAAGFHLFPFRTEKLSPPAPMVLHTRGRVGRRLFNRKPRIVFIRFGASSSAMRKIQIRNTRDLSRTICNTVKRHLRRIVGLYIYRATSAHWNLLICRQGLLRLILYKKSPVSNMSYLIYLISLLLQGIFGWRCLFLSYETMDFAMKPMDSVLRGGWWWPTVSCRLLLMGRSAEKK